MAIWSRSSWTDSGHILAMIDPSSPPGEASGRPLHEWHAHLVETGDLDGAIDFMAHALARYDCIVWAARAAIAIGAIDRSDPLAVTVLQWIDNPEDSLRRAAGAAAETVKADTPVKLLCLAVYVSGGSLAPEDMTAVQPPSEICATLAAAALLLGAHNQPDPDEAMRQVLEFGEAMVTAQ